jgi:hypothetical protein
MRMPSLDELSLLEYRLRSVAIGHRALSLALTWEDVPSIDIYFDGKLGITGKATAFTNAAIEVAIIHCRALLEFLGLGIGSNKNLIELKKRNRNDDICIEQFTGLSRLSIATALIAYPGPSPDARDALAYVAYLANKGLAHTTSSFTKHDRGSELLEIAFRGVPSLIVNNFYAPLGLEPPPYQLEVIKVPVDSR